MTAGQIASVGRCVGSWLDAPNDALRFGVGRGREVVEIGAVEFAGWSLGFGSLNGADPRPTRPGLESAVADAGHPDPTGLFDALAERGLVVEVSDDGGAAARFARTHRLVPLMWGLGPSQRRRGWRGIGLPGWELATVSADVYEVWALAPTCRTLWSACERVVEAGGGGGDAPVDPERVLNELLGCLHCLLAGGAACLDVVEATRG